jgi:hypothetical protein
MWMALCMLASPLGVIFGYGLTYGYIKLYDWQTAFIAQGIIFFGLIFVFLFVPSEYLEINKIQK